jgi:hypothetical protein
LQEHGESRHRQHRERRGQRPRAAPPGQDKHAGGQKGQRQPLETQKRRKQHRDEEHRAQPPLHQPERKAIDDPQRRRGVQGMLHPGIGRGEGAGRDRAGEGERGAQRAGISRKPDDPRPEQAGRGEAGEIPRKGHPALRLRARRHRQKERIQDRRRRAGGFAGIDAVAAPRDLGPDRKMDVDVVERILEHPGAQHGGGLQREERAEAAQRRPEGERRARCPVAPLDGRHSNSMITSSTARLSPDPA